LTLAAPARAGYLVITAGGTYTGNYQGDASHPAVTVNTTQPVTLYNCNLSGPGALIFGPNTIGHKNITVIGCAGYGLNPNNPGQPKGRFLTSDYNDNIDVEHCYMDGTGGIYLGGGYQGNGTAANTITIRYNVAHNIDSRPSDGHGGYQTGSTSRGASDNNTFYQFVQLNHQGSVPNVEIAWNQVINDPGNSRVEDNINVGGGSGGTSSSPLLIHDNYIQGAYPSLPASQSFSGGGILLSDGATTNSGFFVQAYNNQVVSTTNYGISIDGNTGGHDCVLYNNRIVSSGLLPNNQPIYAMNVGTYVTDSVDGKNYLGYNNLASIPNGSGGWIGNLIGWVQPGGTQRNGGTGAVQNPAFFDLGSGAANSAEYGRQTVWGGAGPNRGDEYNEYLGWLRKTAGAHIAVGANALTNPNFDGGDITGWSVWNGSNGSGAGAAYAETVGGAHSGAYHGTLYKNSAYEVACYQDVNVPNGSWTLTAWVEGSGGQTQATMEASNYGGNKITQNIPAAGSWTRIAIPNVNVTSGKFTVGFYTKAGANQWVRFDDVSLTPSNAAP
jgi:hypothetical protein